MNRRKMMAIASFGGLAGMFESLMTGIGRLFASQTPISSDKRVIIVGGGISGLAAAKYLKGRGVDAVLLESTEKLGGRLRTDRSLGIPFDEGASWIHGPLGNPITKIA
ncbi:MAG: FAD-dependent oxidoreductase, partial [Pseudomonadota bacterium]